MVAWVVNYLVRNLDPLGAGVFIVSVALFAQSLLSLYLMLYSWEHAGRLAASSGPRLFVAPRLSFSVILPARHEEAVIAGTIRRLLDADYPPDLIETVVVCHADDTGTIAEARRAIRELATDRVRVQTFSNGPINKPHGLNVGLACTSNEVVTIFDAEDDIDPSIFNVINTTMLQESVGIVQAGVQLMNFRDAWFAVHNVLEYFFWFKSRLHFHADVGMIPLGGNTVFVKRRLINRIGGWDEQCLTEDADLGLRLSVLGETIRVVYDPQHVTREETPASIGSLVRQRTRWHQGFLQVLRKGAWLRLPTFGQRLLAAYTLSYPLFQGILTVLWPVTVAGIVWLRLPVPVVIAAFLPLYALVFQLLISVLGIFVFSREYGLRVPLFMPLAMAVTFLPYQLLLGVSAVRAVYRELQGQNSWEKTAHLGAHRLSPEADFIPVVQPRELSHVGPEPRVRRSA
jgi:cellulose synthase/poly-beta-1,6-N-acetylglucosamine synthase-like glycosyltransferase